tara:strand:+ start:494 stop:595 length:102 start_codon:yes stop_codon:yes gene_type:complete
LVEVKGGEYMGYGMKPKKKKKPKKGRMSRRKVS